MTAEMPPPPGLDEFVQLAADLLDGAAAIVLESFVAPMEPGEGSQWIADRAAWEGEFNDNDGEIAAFDEVAGWVSESLGVYLAETAHLLRAIAELLRSGRVFKSIDVLVRSVLEHVGHINWILDGEITPQQRAARAGLEVGSSYFTYRAGLNLLDQGTALSEDDEKVRARIKEAALSQRKHLKGWFEVVQPPDDPCKEGSGPTGDVGRWIASGEGFPNLGLAVQHALEQGHLPPTKAKGVYAALSGFSHPNVIFSREHSRIDEDQRITFSYQREELEKLIRFALFSFGDALKRWVAYHDWEHDRVVHELDGLANRLDAITFTT